MPTPSSLTSSTMRSASRGDVHVDAARPGVLDGVDGELLGDPERQRGGERSVIDRAVYGEPHGAGGRERGDRRPERGLEAELARGRRMERGDDGPRLRDRLVDAGEHPRRRRRRRLGGVLSQRDQPLHRAVVQRLGQASPLALLGIQDLLQEPLAVCREPGDLLRARIRHFTELDQVVAVLQPVHHAARKRDDHDEHGQEADGGVNPALRPEKHRRHREHGIDQLERQRRERGRRWWRRSPVRRRRGGDRRPTALAASRRTLISTDRLFGGRPGVGCHRRRGQSAARA